MYAAHTHTNEIATIKLQSHNNSTINLCVWPHCRDERVAMKSKGSKNLFGLTEKCHAEF